MTQERVAQVLNAPARAEPPTRFFVRDRGKLVLLWAHEVLMRVGTRLMASRTRSRELRELTLWGPRSVQVASG